MNAISTSFVIYIPLCGFAQSLHIFTGFSEQLVLPEIPHPVLQVTDQPSELLKYLPVWLDQLSPIENIDRNVCQPLPTGIGIPGFGPGIPQSAVLKMFGVPTKTQSGYWPNTKAISYELIPGRVSLGFLFDQDSEELRQTEAAFDDLVDAEVILKTLNGMLGCKLNEDIKEGFHQVRQRKSRHYEFKLDALEGVIERDERDRIYIGIWEADLH